MPVLLLMRKNYPDYLNSVENGAVSLRGSTKITKPGSCAESGFGILFKCEIKQNASRVSFTLKANMGTWHNRVPIIKDNFGIRTITPQECLALQGFPKSFGFPDIPIKSMYKQSAS